MTRRGFLKASVGAAIGLLAGCARPAARPRARRNLVLIVSDTLRADHLGCYGSPLHISPRVDDLARRGTLFENVLSAAPVTAASIATLMTGAYQTRHGIMRNAGLIPSDLITLAEACRGRGYNTAGFVSSPALKPDVLNGIDRGFYPYDCSLPRVERKGDAWHRDAAATTEAVIRWLRQRPDQPFFLWIHYFEPHGPYEVPDASLLERLGTVPRLEAEPTSLPVMNTLFGTGGIPHRQVLGEARDPVYYRAHYAARTAYVDGQTGRVLDELGALGLDDNTIIAFTSDHGELLGEHEYYFQHAITVLQAVLHVPLILAGPGIGGGRRVSALTGNADIMPTLLTLLGVGSEPVASQVQGQDLTPLLRQGGVQEIPRYALCRWGPERCVVLGRYKYSEKGPPEAPVGRLVDLRADPAEERDASGEEPVTASRMKRMLTDFMQTAPHLLRPGGGPAPRLSKESENALRSLGYLE